MKLDVVFGLEGATWPSLLVDGAGVIRQANRAAIQAFGPNVAPGSASLSAIWLAENDVAPAPFLVRAQESPNTAPPLKLLGDG
ncbi:MAG TPA: hypothetical protein VN281_12615, partial [Verrucomicrobiae bacterium]|nr:hypothetical protein [Verrucomicrobiae bacterium]